MSVTELLNSWVEDPTVKDNIAVWKTESPLSAELIPFPNEIDYRLQSALANLGIHKLYKHQADALDFIGKKFNVVLQTGTASGKSLCYLLPVFNKLLQNAQSSALLLFPTKALAQDQFQFIKNLNISLEKVDLDSPHPPVHPATFDGDTSLSHRSLIREKSRLLLTNPDMLHSTLLPQHISWKSLFSGLAFIVIDEIHIYRGVFGSHVANVIRRLKRISSFYGSNPVFILTSATISNPCEHAENLVEDKVYVVDKDFSPKGKKNFIIYNPPVTDPSLGLRRSAFQEAVKLVPGFLSFKVQTLIFSRSRKSVERLLTILQQRYQNEEISSAKEIRSYRSGYLPNLRRDIEAGIKAGDTKVVVATNALELGIDIGGMSAVILLGYPGTIAATRQQAGRAGRGTNESLAVFVASSDPLDQFLVSHPDFLLDRSPERALINANNSLILLKHIQCAAYELPFNEDQSFGKINSQLLLEYLDFLVQQKELIKIGPEYFWTANHRPAKFVSLRSSSNEEILLNTRIENASKPIVLGKVDFESAFWMVHPGAIYLHEGEAYLVENLDLVNKNATLLKVDSEYFTEPLQETDIHILEVIQQNDGNKVLCGFGEMVISNHIVGYKKINWTTNQSLSQVSIDLPPTELVTIGFWVVIKNELIDKLRSSGQWTNDANDYGSEWDAIKRQIRCRDSFHCQICGAKESGRAHDVHHIIPFRSFLKREEANLPSNLVTLCHDCHQRAEVNVRIQSGLAGLAYVLSHLAPLFLMCDSKDIGISYEPKSHRFDSLPAITIYDQIPGGIGLSEHMLSIFHEVVSSGLELLSNCNCLTGCPSCSGPGGENGMGGKRETIAILTELANE